MRSAMLAGHKTTRHTITKRVEPIQNTCTETVSGRTRDWIRGGIASVFIGLLAGAVLGPLVLFNWWLVRKEDCHGSEPLMASTISVILILWQGAVGWLTVKLDNENWSVALHLGSELAFTLCLIWLGLALSRSKGEELSWRGFGFGFSDKWRTTIVWLMSSMKIKLKSENLEQNWLNLNIKSKINKIL